MSAAGPLVESGHPSCSSRARRFGRRLGTLLSRDALLAWRNGQVAVTLAIMVLMAALVLFLPARVEPRPRQIILDLSEGFWLSRGAPAAAPDFAEDREAFEARLSGSSRAVGVVVSGGPESPRVELSFGSAPTDRKVALTRAAVDELLARARGGGSAGRFPVRLMRPGHVPIPLNLRGVPVFLIFEAGILGFLLVAVFLFQEKAEGTVRAYRVGPGGTAVYVAAKVAVFVAMSLVYGAGVVAAAAAKGARPDAPELFAVLALASATMTFLGLGFAAFFDNLSQWFFPGLAVLALNILPIFAYAVPGFDLPALKAIPSYDLLFMARDAIFSPGIPLEAGALLRALGWLIGSALFCSAAVRARLMRGTP